MAYEVNIKGLEKLDELIAKAERLGDALGGVKDQAEGIGAASGVASAKTSSATTGIYSRRDRYRAEHEDLINRGVSAGTEYNDAKVRMLKSEKAVERWEKSLEPRTEADRLRDALMTSRIGPDGKLYPIVGRMMSAGLLGEDNLGALKDRLANTGGVAGRFMRAASNVVSSGAAEGASATATAARLGAEATPAAAAVANAAAASASAGGAGGAAGLAAAASAIGAMVGAVGVSYGLAAAGNNIQNERTRGYYTGGGGDRASGQITGLGYLLGQSPGDVANDAVRFGDTLRSGGYGAAYFRQRGLSDKGLWQDDKSSNYVRAIKMLAEEPDERTAIRVARDTGMEDRLWLRDLDKDRRDRMIDLEGNLSNERARRTNANYNATKAEFNQAKDSFLVEAGDWFMGKANAFVRGGPLNVARDELMRAWDAMFGDKDAPKSERKSTASNDKREPFGENVGRAAREETIGGGERVRRAVPAGWRQIQMDDALSGQAANLGAFNL